MTDTERAMLIAEINARGLPNGTVSKGKGRWFVNGLAVGPLPMPEIAPQPIINLSHYVDGGLFETIIIEHKKGDG